jgi:hypothetical protein
MSHRDIDGFVNDLLQYDDVLQARIEAIADLVDRESSLRENAEFYKHRCAHRARRSADDAVRVTGSDSNERTPVAAFESARHEMQSVFRKLHRKLAAITIAAVEPSASGESDEVDGGLNFTLSNLTSMLRASSAISLTTSNANLRSMARRSDADRRPTDVARELVVGEDTLASKRRQFLSQLEAETELHADRAYHQFKVALTAAAEVAPSSICGCDKCLRTFHDAVHGSSGWCSRTHSARQTQRGVREPTLQSSIVQQHNTHLQRRNALQRDIGTLTARAQELRLELAKEKAMTAIHRCCDEVPPSSLHQFDHGVAEALLQLHNVVVANAQRNACQSLIGDCSARVRDALSVQAALCI